MLFNIFIEYLLWLLLVTVLKKLRTYGGKIANKKITQSNVKWKDDEYYEEEWLSPFKLL